MPWNPGIGAVRWVSGFPRHHKVLSLQPRGKTIFAAEFHPGVANPLLTFHMRAERSGTLDFVWTDQAGQRWSKQAELRVT